MKNLYLKIVLLLAAMLGSVGIVMASNLPDCPSSGYFHNCFGTYTWADGEQYIGEWKYNKRTGQGTYTYASGNKYVGEYKDDKANGQGTFTYANGDKYVGMFKDGKKHGQGTYTYADGTVEEGIWKVGEFQYAQKLPANSSSSGNSKLDKHKEFCEEIGFNPGTEKFGDCVMKMMDKD